MRVYYSPDYIASKHEFDTTRKAGRIALSLTDKPIKGVELTHPQPIHTALLNSVHAPDYVNAVRTGFPRDFAETSGLPWDEGIWTMATAMTGGTMDACREAVRGLTVSGSLSSGLHHAQYSRGNGFCTFNGLVLGARCGLNAGAGRVLILDLDAHCGGGTNSLILEEADIAQVDLSTSAYDSYAPGPRTSLQVTSARGFGYVKLCMAMLEEGLAWLEQRDESTPGLIIYNSGMDAYCAGGIDHGISLDILQIREEMVFSRLRHYPVAWVLAGGYEGPDLDAAGVVNLHRLTLDAAVKYRTP